MSRRQSTSTPVPPLTSPPPDAKQGPREEQTTSTIPIKLPTSISSDKPAPLLPPLSLSASPLHLSAAYGHLAPGNHKISEVPSATALEHKLDEKEEVKNMARELIEAESLRLQGEQQAVMLARLEEEKREREKITNDTAESELMRKFGEKRKTKADTSKPWIKRKPKREEIDPMVLASLTSLESRGATLPEHNASTSQRPISTLLLGGNNIQDSDIPFALIPAPVPDLCSSPIEVDSDENNIVESTQATCEQGDVAATCEWFVLVLPFSVLRDA